MGSVDVLTSEGIITQEVDVDNSNAYPSISGEELAGTVPGAEDYISAIVELLFKIQPGSYELNKLETFEQVLVGVFAHKFHLMREKHLGYGEKNIKNDNDDAEKAVRKILTRATDKIERGLNILGDSEKQVKEVREIVGQTPDDADQYEMAYALKQIAASVFPAQEYADESIDDTVLDLGNYGDIAYSVLKGAWAKPMERV